MIQTFSGPTYKSLDVLRGTLFPGPYSVSTSVYTHLPAHRKDAQQNCGAFNFVGREWFCECTVERMGTMLVEISSVFPGLNDVELTIKSF